jgi:hypothetical protein
MPRFRLVFPILVLLAALAFGAGNAAAKASSASKAPCWKTLLNDWYDGRIDGTYPVRCYREAINNLPVDISTYSAARNDLSRALLGAIAANSNKGGPPLGPDSMVPPSKRKLQSSKKDESFFQRLANTLGPGNATSIPLPLLILAGLGFLLVAGAGASFAARRIQARRAQPATIPPGQADPQK